MTWNPLTWIPWLRDGRQTLIYVTLALCGPALTACIMWALNVVEHFPGADGEARLAAYVDLAKPLTWALMVIVLALACFVSIRAIKVGRDGISAEGREDDVVHDGDQVTVTKP